jgi:hypothetical protein
MLTHVDFFLVNAVVRYNLETAQGELSNPITLKQAAAASFRNRSGSPEMLRK